ncbi:NAD(P)-dependent oxidoreductase [Sphingomonas psychrotolerans]|uniref:NAD(P)-dependent oxidoreductase n=1 Tax=Sphingomonas psychrotolerans TaxID=1327635 RepID=A0ABU3MY17_9SPHN|nr:NAD(P)-dependent oxidoreductase [Sphingomonas psychrotolerans]MDT8757204.1 NAD(P)-dependent oxidoreductase [Sphingomonas psychrotolerans]
MTERVLIAGAGQVGVFAAKELGDAGHEVWVADKAPAPGFFARYGGTSPERLFKLDLAHSTAVAAAARQHRIGTAVLAFRSPAMPAEHGQGNGADVCPVTLCGRALIAAGVSRLILISSFAVYGRNNHSRLRETDAPAPETPYGQAKLRAEGSLISEAGDGVELIILRPCGIYGPIRVNGGSHSARLIDMLLFAAARDKPVTLEWAPGDEDEYIYVKDVARAVRECVEHRRGSGLNIYNVGAGAKVSAPMLREAVRSLFPDAPILLRGGLKQRPRLPLLDSSKIACDLEFRPQFPLVEGLRDQARLTGLV